MSVKSIKKILFIESQLYGIIASTIRAIIATAKYNYNIEDINKSILEGGYARTVEYRAPWAQIITLFAIFIAMGFIVVYVSKDKF